MARYGRESKGHGLIKWFPTKFDYIISYIDYDIFNDKIEFNIWNSGLHRSHHSMTTMACTWHMLRNTHMLACIHCPLQAYYIKFMRLICRCQEQSSRESKQFPKQLKKIFYRLFLLPSPISNQTESWMCCRCVFSILDTSLLLLLLLLLWYALEHISFSYTTPPILLNVIIIMSKIYIELITFRHKIRKSMAKIAIMFSFSPSRSNTIDCQ